MNAAAREFVERMGLMGESWGVSRTAGRMIGLLLIDGTAKSLDELAEELSVSKGSISTNARSLLSIGLLERELRSERRDFYRISNFPWETVYDVSIRRMVDLKKLLDSQQKALPEEMKGARDRLKAWASFYDFLIDDQAIRMERWRDFVKHREIAKQHIS